MTARAGALRHCAVDCWRPVQGKRGAGSGLLGADAADRKRCVVARALVDHPPTVVRRSQLDRRGAREQLPAFDLARELVRAALTIAERCAASAGALATTSAKPQRKWRYTIKRRRAQTHASIPA